VNVRLVPIGPADRAVGARLAHDIVTQRNAGESVGDQRRRYVGTAGQSFGAFLTGGLRLELDGDANDYVGKSMEGGTIVVRGPGAPGEPAIGTACFYGARGGFGYISGAAGERLAVRNSGGSIVVEGAGDHACEYMTAGTVAIAGSLGRNIASDMTGGELFVISECAARALGSRRPALPRDRRRRTRGECSPRALGTSPSCDGLGTRRRAPGRLGNNACHRPLLRADAQRDDACA